MEAEKRVRELYNAENKHAAPVSAIVEHWGYRSSSSGGRTTLAALKKFGLLEDEGSGEERTGRLTDLAVELVLNPDPETARRKAALFPKLHRQMWEEYGTNLPSPAALRYRLIREFGFTESGADEFVEEYEATVAYAGLADGDHREQEHGFAVSGASNPGEPPRKTAVHDHGLPGQPPPASDLPPPSGMTIPIPLLGEAPVYVTGTFPLSEASWAQMIRVLEAMKPGLVDPTAGRKKNLPPTASPERNAPGEADGGVRTPEYDSHDG